MEMISELQKLGVNTDEALGRFMNNSALYIKMLRKLPAASKDLEVMEYLESDDYDKALENAHTLKGVTGNLSITPLYNAYTEIVSFLREGEHEKAKNRMKETAPLQEEIIRCIESNE